MKKIFINILITFLAFTTNFICEAREATPTESSNDECIEILYSFIYKGKTDNNASINDENLTSVTEYGAPSIYISFSQINKGPIAKVIFKNSKQETILFENEIIGVNLDSFNDHEAIGIFTPNYILIIFGDCCYIYEANNGRKKANATCWQFIDDPLFPADTYLNSKSLNNLYRKLLKVFY